jgi:hypothetical protein
MTFYTRQLHVHQYRVDLAACPFAALHRCWVAQRRASVHCATVVLAFQGFHGTHAIELAA